MSKLFKKYETIFKNGVIKQSEIISLKSVLQGYNTSMTKEEKGKIEELMWNNETSITEEQTRKGYEFLMNQWKTPTGKERKNNPFGYREQEALETFKSFTFVGFYDASNYTQTERGLKNLMPIYDVNGKDTCFQYYYNGTVNIIG